VQSSERPLPKHVAIIMDGNGRWAKGRGRPRLEGHVQGAESVRETVEKAVAMGIGYLTLYAFSLANWKRPTDEVHGLMQLLVDFAGAEQERLIANGVRVQVIGRFGDLPQHTQNAVQRLMAETAHCTKMTLSLALSYGGREDVVMAAKTLAEKVARGDLAPAMIDEAALRGAMSTAALPDVDLLIRTSGESRLSDFLLIEAAYAELMFLPVMWPDFRARELEAAINSFMGRERRFGQTGEQIRLRSVSLGA
jgi:undecaprenyl diphosphate synthase